MENIFKTECVITTKNYPTNFLEGDLSSNKIFMVTAI